MLQVRMLAKLEEVVGKSRGGEEPEGEVVAGPSGETMVYSSGNTPLFLFCFFLTNHFTNYTILLMLLGEFPSGIMLLPHIVAHLARRWVQWGRPGDCRDEGGTGAGSCAELDGGGGPSSIAWGGGMGAVVWGIPPFSFFSLDLHFSQCLYLNLMLMLDPIFSLLWGLNLLKRASTLWKEAQQLKSEGLQKIESAVAGLEVVDFYRLLRGTVSHTPISSIPPHLKCHHAPTATVSKLPPQESKQVTSEVSDPVDSEAELAPEASSSAGSQASEVAISGHMTPIHLQLGDIKRVYKCQVEGCTEGPSTSNAEICAHVHREHLGVGLMCPSCAKTFFNLHAPRCHKKSHFLVVP